ncbi:uncharacterized protein LOC132642333 [Lycium barbarum]|uniref:uncharacterized protein LOC132642333 n=1 Tax=Lycium barbarum TaxID=112863 RepID=UPI00293F0FBB|nr:uncharacterized protein LOC132642333 [Lycium barbarum]
MENELPNKALFSFLMIVLYGVFKREGYKISDVICCCCEYKSRLAGKTFGIGGSTLVIFSTIIVFAILLNFWNYATKVFIYIPDLENLQAIIHGRETLPHVYVKRGEDNEGKKGKKGKADNSLVCHTITFIYTSF